MTLMPKLVSKDVYGALDWIERVTALLEQETPFEEYTPPTSEPIAVLYSELPAASSVEIGTRAFVSDSNAAVFNSIVGGGGINKLPVFSDGTNWRVG
jgi:hypothetical protein